jgi:hypothetical protein
MPTYRQTADGSGFLQETTGDQMAPDFSTADTCSSNESQGGFYGAPVITLVPTRIVKAPVPASKIRII